jgi:hypothetical protein
MVSSRPRPQGTGIAFVGEAALGRVANRVTQSCKHLLANLPYLITCRNRADARPVLRRWMPVSPQLSAIFRNPFGCMPFARADLEDARMPAMTAAEPRRIRRVLGVEQPRVDGRASQARLFRRLTMSYVAELGGETNLSEFDRQQVAKLCAIDVRLADLRKQDLHGRAVESDLIIRLTGEHRRLLTELRAKTRKKPPSATSLVELLAREENRA